MLDKKLWWTGAALVLTAAIALALGNLPVREEAVPLQEPVAGVRQEVSEVAEESAPAPDYAYMIKEYEGYIAVFIPGDESPQMTFDVLVKFLPDYDRIQLREGIPVKDYETLTVMIEDYIS
jgi:hypothetical protein